ncbi:MAG: chemoreceptor glutamine deamidase CheD [Burkholderiales bacterium]|nr:chemoreceptor glutamine deamidase CheD [Burkholderiales bacterium]
MREASDRSRQESKTNGPLRPIYYHDRNFNLPAAKIGPGEFYATQRDIVVVTVLGSCVSACLRDPITKIGGMNHFMLPYHSSEPDGPLSESARYGAYAMEVLVNHMLTLGAKRERIEAKIFGAGRIVPGMSDIGSRNASFAVEYLAREKIRVVAQDLGSEQATKVYFFPWTGRVLIKRLRALGNDTVLVRERDYAEQLDTLTKAPPVDLFV